MAAKRDGTREDRLVLKYNGDLASLGELGAYDLSDAIAGFSDFVTAVGMAKFGDEFDIRPKISALQKGSFDIEFVLHLLSSDTAGLLYAAFHVPGGFSLFVKLVADAFNLLKHLKGEPPRLVEHQKNNSVNVTNNNGVINNFSVDTLVIISDPSASRAAAKFASKPLIHSAKKLEIQSNGKTVASATREDVGSFVPIQIGEILAEHSQEIHLTIQTAVLEGKTNWKFNDGQKTFSAPIEDKEFLGNVDRGREAFRKGDELIVRMRSTQKRLNGQLKAEYAIEKVMRHISRRPDSPPLL